MQPIYILAMKTRVFIFILTTLLLPSFLKGQTVNIGDILCTDGSTVRPDEYASSGRTAQGVVFYVDNSGQQGWAVNLRNETNETHWVDPNHYYDSYDIPDLPSLHYSRQAIFDLDGYRNTEIIRATHGADWYPAAWAVDFEHGWYLPAAGQLRWLIAYVNEVNESLRIVNGSPFIQARPNWYWSSTEQDAMHAFVVSDRGSTANYMKWNYYNTVIIGVRSIRDFSVAKSRRQQIGDVVTTMGGQTGVVFYVAPDSDEYWLTALNDLPAKYAWGNNSDIADLENYEQVWYELHGIHCGYDATRTMREAQGGNPQYAATHVDMDDGWHIPSSGQLSKLIAALPYIEDKLIQNGGQSPSADYYWTSTEYDAEKAWVVNFGGNVDQEGAIVARPKTEMFSVRPVWSLSCETPPLPEPELPDNILDSDCNHNTPQPFEGGQLMYQTPSNINVYSTPLCGDIDDDGIVDIVVAQYTATQDYNHRHWSNELGIYSGNNLSLQNTISIPQEVYLQYLPLGIAKYPKEDGTMQGAVFAVCCDNKLRSYSRNGQLLNTSDEDVPCDGTPNFADFNGDGYPEVFVGNAIFDAATLKRLCVGPESGNKGLSHRGSPPSSSYDHRTYYAIPFAFDVIGDGRLELICGNTIYDVNIVSRANPTLNSITVGKTITPPNGFPQDGQVALADLDIDGEIDVLVTNDMSDDCTEDYSYLYAYKPSTGAILFQHQLLCRSTGFPVICNLDTDPRPEIVFIDYQYNTNTETMYCLRYNGSGLTTVWNIHHHDPSGMTTMAFFDFDLDENPEIVYRDAYNLNIISGQDGQVLYAYPMYSGTAGEHPVVADVNNDGHAEIVVPGLLEYYDGVNGHGNLLMFGNENWPNARKVWNQYAYNITNVNNDLTIPHLCFDNATVFTSQDGTIRRPYNSFLQQVYYITPEGEPYNPDGTIEVEIDGTTCSVFTFNGTTYNTEGHYEQLIESETGCDTLFLIDVVMTDIYHKDVVETICDESYTWNGTTYTTSGDYEQSFTSIDGCDSIVTLHLSLYEQYHAETDTTVCGSIVWNGQEYHASGLYEYDFTTASGCDSIVKLILTVNPYPAAIPEIEGLTAVFVATDMILGQYFYSIDSMPLATHYEWILDGADWTMDTIGTQCGLWITSAGIATLTVRAWNDCGYSEQSIVIHAGFYDVEDYTGIPFNLYPNPAKDKIVIEAEGIERVKIYNILGQCVIDKLVPKMSIAELSLPELEPAPYIVEIQTFFGTARTKIIIKDQ